MTARVALIGRPLRRRHSEVMHNAAFAHYGIDARYELRDTPAGDLGAFFAEVRDPGWLGFQVTAPHKEAVIEHLDEVESARIGAVNSGVRRDDGTLAGFNTDSTGFLSAVETDLGVAPGDVRVVVVGAGGAARAVTYGLLSAGAPSVVVVNRTEERARRLAEDFSDLGTISACGAGDPVVSDHLRTADLVVNATTVGMTSPELPFDVTVLRDDAAVFDLVYVPPDTPLVRAATARGLRVVNGLEMLVRQAEEAFARWTGVAGSAGVMRRALEEWDGEGATER